MINDEAQKLADKVCSHFNVQKVPVEFLTPSEYFGSLIEHYRFVPLHRMKTLKLTTRGRYEIKPVQRIVLFPKGRQMGTLIHETCHHLQFEKSNSKRFDKGDGHDRIFWQWWDRIIQFLEIDVNEDFSSWQE